MRKHAAKAVGATSSEAF